MVIYYIRYGRRELMHNDGNKVLWNVKKWAIMLAISDKLALLPIIKMGNLLPDNRVGLPVQIF